MNYRLHAKVLPLLLLVNNAMLLYAAYSETNCDYLYLLTVLINMGFMIVDEHTLTPTHNWDKR